MSDPAIRFSHVSKQFRLTQTNDSIRDLIAGGLRRILRGRGSSPESTFDALRDVSFDVLPGQTLGIIGPNGAGKSTVLKLLAGILRPDSGQVRVNGRLAALIEVGAGFHGDLSGRENIFLNGAILGMNRLEIRRKLDAIVAFAGIERFLDMPVKRYSSGMYARLGFSIAAHVEPEVLLVDEVLSVGDAMFRLRCLERMQSLVRSGTTLVFVTHDLDQMQSICTRAIVLEEGGVNFDGRACEAVGRYLGAMSRAFADRPGDVDAREHHPPRVELLGLRWVDSEGGEFVQVNPGAVLRAEMTLCVKPEVRSLIVELNMRNATQEPMVSINSGRDEVSIPARAGEIRVALSLPSLPICGGQYFWNVRVWDADRGTVELDTPFRFPMVVNDGGRATGTLCLEHSWSYEAPDSRIDVEPVADATVEELAPAGNVA